MAVKDQGTTVIQLFLSCYAEPVSRIQSVRDIRRLIGLLRLQWDQA